MYNIKVKNKSGKCTGISQFFVNDLEVKDKKVFLQDDGKIYNIEIVM